MPIAGTETYNFAKQIIIVVIVIVHSVKYGTDYG